jgi:putative endonuclease
MIFVYVIQNRESGFRYVGITKDIVTRLKRHNSGGNRSTKSHRPFEVVHLEEYGDYTVARQREKFLKSGVGRKFLDSLLDKKN